MERSELSQQTHQYEHRADVSINEIIDFFKEKEMHPFLTALISEISFAMNIDDPEIKAFDVFKIHIDLTESEKEEMTTALFEFYGQCKASNFQGDFNETDTTLSTDTCDSKT